MRDLMTGAGMHTLLAVVVLLVVRAGWQWWTSPWCAVCYRGWAWRRRVVRRSWGIPGLMHVCARCAREIDRREASHAR